jgi:hypothetical protein
MLTSTIATLPPVPGLLSPAIVATRGLWITRCEGGKMARCAADGTTDMRPMRSENRTAQWLPLIGLPLYHATACNLHRVHWRSPIPNCKLNRRRLLHCVHLCQRQNLQRTTSLTCQLLPKLFQPIENAQRLYRDWVSYHHGLPYEVKAHFKIQDGGTLWTIAAFRH